MDSAVPRSDLSSPAPPDAPRAAPIDQLMRAYVGYLAGWFEIAQLAAGRQLQRAGVREPLLND